MLIAIYQFMEVVSLITTLSTVHITNHYTVLLDRFHGGILDQLRRLTPRNWQRNLADPARHAVSAAGSALRQHALHERIPALAGADRPVGEERSSVEPRAPSTRESCVCSAGTCGDEEAACMYSLCPLERRPVNVQRDWG